MPVGLYLVSSKDSIKVGDTELTWEDDLSCFIWDSQEYSFRVERTDAGTWVASVTRLEEMIWSGSERPSAVQAGKELRNFSQAAIMAFSNLC